MFELPLVDGDMQAFRFTIEFARTGATSRANVRLRLLPERKTLGTSVFQLSFDFKEGKEKGSQR
jgi:hypothetical protein